MTDYLTTNRRLDERFSFSPKTPILPTLQDLLTAVEDRLAGIEEEKAVLDTLVANITDVALTRLDETFTPLILEAESKLQQFGAAFSATSATSLVVGTGAKALILPSGERETFVYSEYVVLAHVGGTESMTCRVTSYDRSIGQLIVTCVSFVGSGTFSDWKVLFGIAPNLSHESRTDNPHSVTAAQVNAYTKTEVDNLFTASTNTQGAVNSSLQTQITALQAGSDIGALQSQITALQTQMETLIKQTRWIG